MDEQLELLRNIQEIDLQIQEIRGFQESFPEKMNSIQEALEQERSEITGEQEKLKELVKTRKKLEQSVEDNEIKIVKYREQQYQVKTNEEYRTVLDQIDETQKLKSKQEDEILKLMEQIEVLTAETKELEKNFAEVEKTYEERTGELQKQMDSCEAELDAKVELMEGTKSQVDSSLYERYLRIKDQRGGLAVVETRDGICTGCNLNIPPQMYYEILKNSGLFACPNCNRLLYYDGPPQANNNMEHLSEEDEA